LQSQRKKIGLKKFPYPSEKIKNATHNQHDRPTMTTKRNTTDKNTSTQQRFGVMAGERLRMKLFAKFELWCFVSAVVL